MRNRGVFVAAAGIAALAAAFVALGGLPGVVKCPSAPDSAALKIRSPHRQAPVPPEGSDDDRGLGSGAKSAQALTPPSQRPVECPARAAEAGPRSIELLLARLRSEYGDFPASTVRKDFRDLEELLSAGGKECAGPVIAAVQELDPCFLRVALVFLLGASRSDTAHRYLMDLVRTHSSEDVAEAAAQALILGPHPDRHATMTDSLVAWSEGPLGTSEAWLRTIERCRTPAAKLDGELRGALLQRLSSGASILFQVALLSLVADAEHAPDLVSVLMGLAPSAHAMVRREIWRILLTSPSEAQEAVAFALAKTDELPPVHGEAAVRALADRYQAETEPIHKARLIALLPADLTQSGGQTLLLSAMTDSSDEVRQEAARRCGRCSVPLPSSLLRRLEQLLTDESEEVRRSSAEALQRHGTLSHLPALERLAADGTWMDAMMAEQAIADIRRRAEAK